MRSFALLATLYSAGALALPKVVIHTVVVTAYQVVTRGHDYATAVMEAPAQTTPCETSIAATVTPEAVQVVHVIQDHPQDSSVEVAPVQTVSPAAVSVSSDSHLNAYENIVIQHHNLHRANHSAAALVWDAGLAATAAKIAQSCVYKHDTKMDGGGYGQNIAAGVRAENVGAVITSLFYNDECGLFENLYGLANIDDMNTFEKIGHFTQIVWKKTSAVGCATVDCSSRGLANAGGNVSPHFTVCNYKSPGNFGGEYAQNVSPPLGHAPISANL